MQNLRIFDAWLGNHARSDRQLLGVLFKTLVNQLGRNPTKQEHIISHGLGKVSEADIASAFFRSGGVHVIPAPVSEETC